MHRKTYLTGLLLFVSIFFMTGGSSQGYVMPSEQLIQFMAKNFSKLKTLMITQITEGENEGDEENGKVFRSKIWMKSPDLFHFEIIKQPEDKIAIKDHIYRGLLIAGGEKRLNRLLSSMGIDLDLVAFTRVDGIVAYRIGERYADSPKIIIEKKRFLPLLITYWPPGQDPGQTTTIRFKDYWEVDKGWYPFEIERSSGGKINERHRVETLEVNMDIDASVFQSAGISPPSDNAGEGGTSEGDRLRRIIKTFEEKYRLSTP